MIHNSQSIEHFNYLPQEQLDHHLEIDPRAAPLLPPLP